MENNTVALSILEDLIHWPLPPADPTDAAIAAAAASANGSVDAPLRDDALLTAGGLEDLDEEPRERKQARYDALRCIPALVQVMGSQWAKIEIVPYLLRCIEEEDAQLSFGVGMSLIHLASHGYSCESWTTPSHDARAGRLLVGTTRPLQLSNLIPVLLRMSASADAGVRLFLVEVVIPILFYGVPLERSVDLREWGAKYLRARPSDGCCVGADSEPKINFDSGGGSSSSSHSNYNNNGGTGMVPGGLWDPFRINLYANRLRSAISIYLCNLNEDNDDVDAPGGGTLPSCSTAVGLHDYTDCPDRREAFRTRWNLFIGLMDSMLGSGCAATVSAAVECIGNVFSCISWSERAEQFDEGQGKSTVLQSMGKLVEFTFAATRLHVGRVIRSSAERPCLDLMTLLMYHRLLVERAPTTAVGTETNAMRGMTAGEKGGGGGGGGGRGEFQANVASLLASRFNGKITLGCGGLSVVEREVWDPCIGDTAPPVMHRVVHMSLLRSLPQFIDWKSSAISGNAVATLDWMNGLSFFSVCDIFSKAVTAPAPCEAAQAKKLEDDDDDERKGAEIGDGNTLAMPLLESDVCRDFGIAEAVLDGLQHLLDELLHPHTVEGFLQQAGCSTHLPSLETKKKRLLQLCWLYRDCVVRMAALPSWKTRWMMTQRLPSLTEALLHLLHRVGTQDASDGCVLVKECVTFLCSLHLEQWSSAPDGDGILKELMHDEEEEVRCVVAVCAARVFCALGQGMFRLVFPHGVVEDLHQKKGETPSAARRAVLQDQHMDPNAMSLKTRAGGSYDDDDDDDDVPLSTDTLLQHLPQLLDATFHCCMSVLCDPEERVRSGAAAGLSELARTLNTMVTVCGLHVRDLCKSTWLRYLDRITASLMTLLNDHSPTVQLALVSELAALLTSSATEVGGNRLGEVAQVRERGLVVCLQSLSQHDVWRYRERYARLLSEMCVRFLAPNSLAVAESASKTPRGVPTLEETLCETSVASGRPSGVVVAEDGLNPLHRFAKEELLPLLVDVLFDKVKVVRDSALDSLVQMCDRLAAARLQLQMASPGPRCSGGGRSSRYRGSCKSDRHILGDGTRGAKSKWHDRHRDDDVFINDTLWPLIINSPKAMATYLSRSSLLRIAVRLGVDKESILLPLFDHLGHDAVLNVRLVVAKELFGILANLSDSTSLPTTGATKIFFTEQEKNGVVLQLLRLLMEDKSSDVRNEAAKALKLCF